MESNTMKPLEYYRRRRFEMICFKTIVIFIVITIWLQLNLVSTPTPPHYKYNYTKADLLRLVPKVLHKFVTPIEENGTIFLKNKPTLNVTDIKRIIAELNTEQTVYNSAIFGPLQNDSLVVVIQVHNRLTYLRHLIVSLALARGISETLVVFSHDVYDEEINSVVQSIDFCKFMQIFYPYSLQTHLHEFPGEDPNDCPRNMSKLEALFSKCNNAFSPDFYGHYREANFTQTKHHWWWKANRVFNQLDVMKNHTGLVVFLEEDHYVAEDFFHVLKLMIEPCMSASNYCNILSLGSYGNVFVYRWKFNKVTIIPLIGGGTFTMGMAFNHTTWNKISNCSEYFCNYDDYNWDWSLQYLSKTCLKDKLYTMIPLGTRVFHMGECGVHHNKKNCGSLDTISRLLQILSRNKRYFYPDSLILVYSHSRVKFGKKFGGWGDVRDHKLCLNMTVN